jgi:hypothetical protein
MSLVVVMLAACGSNSSSRGSDNQELTLVKPTDQTIRRGESNRVAVVIDRDRFEGSIAVRFEGLPRGVRVIEIDRKIGADENAANFTLQADATADLVTNHLVKITVEGPDRLKTSESFELTVKERG